jgi:hypothetical protein
MSSKVSKSYFRLFLFTLFIFTLAFNAFAWGDEGHHITVRIAANYLSPTARTEVVRLLKVDAGNNEDYYKTHCSNVLALLKKSTLTKTEENTVLGDGLACVASWADPPVKSQRPYTSNWHFVDIPVVMGTSATPMLFTYDASRDCRDNAKSGDCALQALERLQPVMGNYKNPAIKNHEFGEELTNRAEALKFFIHIVGDIHQPLHCVTDKKDKNAVNNPKDLGDLGGNTKNASWFGDVDTPYGFMNLHSIWDGGFIGQTMQNNNWTESQYAQELIKTIPNDSAKMSAMQTGDFQSWAAESYNLAVTNGYKKLPKYDTACKMSFTDSKTGTTKTANGCYQLGKDYYNSNNSIVEQQLKSGGVRLAGLLNSTLNS